jgi:predicted  nucleic acid-binding Zn-ribbon protein
MSLSAQIAALECELEDYKNGTFIKDLEDQISVLEDENSDLKSELRDFGSDEDMRQDYKDAITNLERLFDSMSDCADDIQQELRKL